MSAMLTGVGVLVAACGQAVSGTPIPQADGAAACPTMVLFVLDVSLSMEATDVVPSRWTVARRAATDFAYRQPARTTLGLVTFAGTASVQVLPTTDRGAFTDALDNAALAERTATGEGIFSALSAIDTAKKLAPATGPQRIVLLSDGKQTLPADLDAPRGAYTAARAAKAAGVTVSTISLGTASGVVDIPDSAGSARVPVPTDPDSLRAIAELADGEFHSAASLPELDAALTGLTCHS
ncbi:MULTISPECIES: VWA domain-containing protein [unclassified Nocardia]|uniref:VWA domain-containing protein n=1 Tax=unclassified Nocardia TaxID=2637762 RepID=UPI0033A268B6